MLRMSPCVEKKLLNELNNKIFGKDYEHTIGYIFYEQDTPIGISMFLANSEVSVIFSVGLIEEARKKGYGDFFTRSIMLRLSEVGEKIEIKYISDYYKKFGFIEVDGKMVINSEKLIFPSDCCGGK